MKKVLGAIALLVYTAGLADAQSPSAIVHGTVTKIDAGAKSVIVRTDHGMSEVVHVTKTTVFHGTAVGAKDAFHGITEGSVVAAHTTTRSARKVATEIDLLGKDGLKAAEATLSRVDASGKRLIVKTADGAEEVFDMTEHVAAQAATETARGAAHAGKGTVYYTEAGGKKVAHFFKQL